MSSVKDDELKQILATVDDTKLRDDDWNDVYLAIKTLNAQWREIGIALGISADKLDEIEANNKKTTNCLSSVLTEWINQNYDTTRYKLPSWRTLCAALSKASNKKAFIKDLAMEHGGRESQPSNQTPVETTSAAINLPEVYQQQQHLTTSEPKPPTLPQGPPEQGHVPSGQHGEYLTKSTRNVQTVYTHWKLEKIHKEKITGKGITIAIIDDGLDHTHDSVREKCESAQIRGVQHDGQWKHKQAKHGTAVAAIIAGKEYTTTNGSGKEVTIPPGIAPDANLRIYRLSENFTKGDAVAAVNELLDALDHILTLSKTERIDIVSMSVSVPGKYLSIEAKLKQLAEKKIVCIAAAGNVGDLEPGAKFPANFKEAVLSVGALSSEGKEAQFNPQNGIDVYAFGENVVVPSLDATSAASYLDGTSFAVPMVAGFLALLFQCAKEFPKCKGKYEEYHNVSFLREHFIKCHKLCKDKRLLYVESYFLTDLLKCKNHNPSPIVEFYEQVYHDNK